MAGRRAAARCPSPRIPASGSARRWPAFARAGRDKVTLVFSDKLRALGRLDRAAPRRVAGQGRQGAGAGGRRAARRARRVRRRPRSSSSDPRSRATAPIDAAPGQARRGRPPRDRLELNDVLDLGAEFVRWEIATAAAGSAARGQSLRRAECRLGQGEDRELLARWRKTHRFPEWKAVAEETARAHDGPRGQADSVAEGLRAHFDQAQPGDYLAIQAYLTPDAGRGAAPAGDPHSSCATASVSPPRWRMARATCTPPASSTRAGPRTGSSSSSPADDRRRTAIPGARLRIRDAQGGAGPGRSPGPVRGRPAGGASCTCKGNQTRRARQGRRGACAR